MPAYKRTNPAQIQKQRAKILADLEERENVPQQDRMFPNLLEKARRSFVGAVARKRARKNPPPSIEGGKVSGFVPGRNDA
jgi:hypothetical protein